LLSDNVKFRLMWLSGI